MRNKAQIKMLETVGVIVVFLFLLVVFGIFYFGVKETEIEQGAAAVAELRASEVFLRMLYLPELDCPSTSGFTTNCFDTLKLQAFGAVAGDALLTDYFPMFGFSTINVSTVWSRSSRPDGERFFVRIYDNKPLRIGGKSVYRSPVLLFDAATNSLDFGLLEVTSWHEAR